MKEIMIEIPRPRLGQKVYVPTTDTALGGLATIEMVVGDKITAKEVPDTQFDWLVLAKDQLKLVGLHGGSKAMRAIRRVS